MYREGEKKRVGRHSFSLSMYRERGIGMPIEREKTMAVPKPKPILMAVPGLHSFSMYIERRRELAAIHSLCIERERERRLWMPIERWQSLPCHSLPSLYLYRERGRDREIGPDDCLADWLPSRTWKLDGLCHRGRGLITL